jgi:iron complex outermembrane recepter protein
MPLKTLLVSLLTIVSAPPALGTEQTSTPAAEDPNATSEATATVANNSGELAEVVVTAEKRLSTVQDTPISISAVSGSDLLARGVSSLAALAQGTPGVSLKTEGPSQTEIEMRGMTSSGGNSATVGFYLDDIALTGPASAQNGHVVIDPDLYDLNRIEILKARSSDPVRWAAR